MGTLFPVAQHNGTSLLDLAGASYYTARAYRRAAELIRDTAGRPRPS